MKDLILYICGIFGFGALLVFPVGQLYWLWMSFKIGSFFMFVVGFIPPFIIITAPVGFWSLVFGPPDWIYSFFV